MFESDCSNKDWALCSPGSLSPQRGSVLSSGSPIGHHQHSFERGAHYSSAGGSPFLEKCKCIDMENGKKTLSIIYRSCLRYFSFYSLSFFSRSPLWRQQPPAETLSPWRWRCQLAARRGVIFSGMTGTASTPLRQEIIRILSLLPMR